MLFNLLDSASSVLNSSSSGVGNTGGFDWSMLVMIGFFAVLIIVMTIFNKRNQKKREEETKKLLDSIKPGNTVKTIGGICGTVVEVCDENTFVLETGTEKSGKSYLKFDKYSIAQTDAVVEKKEEPKEEPKTEEKKAEPLEEEKKAD